MSSYRNNYGVLPFSYKTNISHRKSQWKNDINIAVTAWTSSSLGARSPGLRSRQIVLVLSVGDVRR